jgi:putative phosphoribosyl transferase
MLSIDRYQDRQEAGQVLADRLAGYAGRPDIQVLALPRGGVPVAYEVATRLGAPLDIFLVRKLGVPGHPELAMGAIAENGARVLNPDIVGYLDIPDAMIDQVAGAEQQEMQRRERVYRDGRPAPDIRGKTVLLIDDGLATGATMKAAVQGLRALQPARLVVAVPVGAPETCEALTHLADEVLCAMTPESFQAVGLWYAQFNQTTDADVIRLLAQARRRQQPASASNPTTGV